MTGPRTRTAVARLASDDCGSVLVTVLLASMLVLALGTMLALTTATETAVAAHHRDAIEGLHAADAALAWAARDLAVAADWDAVLRGTATSSLSDGPAGPRRLADGTAIDLSALTNVLRCGNLASCSAADMDAFSASRPWGRNNPRWQLYVHGAASRVPGVDSRAYVVVWVADDPAETDGDPLTDGGLPASDEMSTAGNPGRGTVSLIAHAYGPGPVRRVVEATLSRIDDRTGVRLLGWRLGS